MLFRPPKFFLIFRFFPQTTIHYDGTIYIYIYIHDTTPLRPHNDKTHMIFEGDPLIN